MALHKKHCEVTRITYSRNILKCMQIHANVNEVESLRDDDDNNHVDWPALANCVLHNTDKVDRRFFGYYNN